MDVNGTPFYSRLGATDWQTLLAAHSYDLSWDADTATVGLAPQTPRFAPGSGTEPLPSSARRGVARDRWGTTWWIADDSRRVDHLPAGTSEAGTLWAVEDLFCQPSPPAGGDFEAVPELPPATLPTLRGLALTPHHFLVVGTLDPGGLLLFDLHAGGRPTWMRWPAAVPDFAPFDLATLPDGGVVVLDLARSGDDPPSDPAHRARLWRLDRFFRVLSPTLDVSPEAVAVPDFEPLDAATEPPPPCPPAPHLTPEWGLPTVSTAVAVESLGDGSLLVLESDPGLPFSRLHRLADGSRPWEMSFEDILEDFLTPEAGPDDAHLAAHDLVFQSAGGGASGSVRGDLFVVDRRGAQVFVFDLEAGPQDFLLTLRPRSFPLRRFTGKGLVGGASGVLYDRGEHWSEVVESPRRRFARNGRVSGLVFDGAQPGVVWHRLFLDACLGDDTAIQVESRTAEAEELLPAVPWFREPSPYLRGLGSELPFHHPFPSRQGPRQGTWELLFQQARGRFLELRLTFLGSGRASPRLRALRVYAPRFSYLEEYLPAVYRDEATSASFLDRFLANVEGLFTTLEGRVAAAEVLCDPRVTPPEYLDWLAGWLGAVLDPEWDEARRRLFLAHAHELYRWRGTVSGLLAAIRLAVDPCPDADLFADLSRVDPAPRGAAVRLVEHFRTRSVSAVALGDASQPEGPRLVAPEEPWRPVDGAAELDRRYRDFLLEQSDGDRPALLSRLRVSRGKRLSSFQRIRFPALPPEEVDERQLWIRFTRQRLGFSYAEISSADRSLYQAFLARRYRRVDRLNRAHRRPVGREYTTFADIEFPRALPAGSVELGDWMNFAAQIVALRRNAHRFTVLIPVEPGEDPALVAQRRARVEEIVEREKPAHTHFDVKLFWALFQVGSARLGLDTQLGEGSRYVASTLGASHLGESFLAEAPPWGLPDRTVIGRDPLTGGPRLQAT